MWSMRVRVDGFGLVGLAVAADVRRDGVEAGLGEGGDLVAPGVPALGETVSSMSTSGPLPASAMCMLMPLVSMVRWEMVAKGAPPWRGGRGHCAGGNGKREKRRRR